jgi:hypothetical protein
MLGRASDAVADDSFVESRQSRRAVQEVGESLPQE